VNSALLSKTSAWFDLIVLIVYYLEFRREIKRTSRTESCSCSLSLSVGSGDGLLDEALSPVTYFGR
jgi:hypothetical protein